MPEVVTIDGPAGAGKSTVARLLAERLGWRLLDTGAMYRAVALAALRGGVDLEAGGPLGELAGRLRVSMPPGKVLLDGEDITGLIRTPEVAQAASKVAAVPAVRARLVAWQRQFAAEFATVTEGRDQGTIVFPDAPRKFYLTASPQARADRRLADLQSRGHQVAFDEVLREQVERDARDAARAVGPMRPAADALLVDTSGFEIAAVLALVERAARDAGPIPWAVDGERPPVPPYFAGLWVARHRPAGRLVAVARTREDAARVAGGEGGLSESEAHVEKIPSVVDRFVGDPTR